MAKARKNGYRLDADYTEETVGFAIESFLTFISFPLSRFSIEPLSKTNERTLGADARLLGRIRGFRPFYMQFKRPSAYPDFSTSRIIEDRKKLKLNSSPRTLYFQLREKQPDHRDYQQNVLLRLRNHLRARNLGDAAYVCPLFLDRSAYRFHLRLAGLSRWPRFWRFHPWDFEELMISTDHRTIRFERIPVLVEHLSIPPHQKVTSAKHRYSFVEAGAPVCFHSPEHVSDGVSSLAVFLKQLSQDFLTGGQKITGETSASELHALIAATALGEYSPADSQTSDVDGAMEGWLKWGQYLLDEYDIHQFALMSLDEAA